MKQSEHTEHLLIQLIYRLCVLHGHGLCGPQTITVWASRISIADRMMKMSGNGTWRPKVSKHLRNGANRPARGRVATKLHFCKKQRQKTQYLQGTIKWGLPVLAEKKKNPEEQLLNFNNGIHVWIQYRKCSVLCISCFSYFKRLRNLQHLLEWPKSGSLTTWSAGNDVGQQEVPFIAGENGKVCRWVAGYTQTLEQQSLLESIELSSCEKM